MNKVKEKPVKQKKENVTEGLEGNHLIKNEKPVRKKKTSFRFLKAINVLGFIDKQMMMKALPFIFFLTGIAVLYIANSYYAEKTVREIDQVSKEIKELKSEFTSTKKDLNVKSGQSQVATAVQPLGIDESREAPQKIVVNKSEQEKQD